MYLFIYLKEPLVTKLAVLFFTILMTLLNEFFNESFHFHRFYNRLEAPYHIPFTIYNKLSKNSTLPHRPLNNQDRYH